ncbi:c3HC zinc finger-like domain-containing protein [Hirsutella rhossiliensis]|uniref:C3HC zinc finger-like domain-containing protein n=1 Tax=Hirsutella rhossiliensis TaxID=111463 RepID=A0A9P8MSV8_9HYPO|nr:c3HC zinc finger-like domain-containing protein [Hirsutella rhossiliensis]KAH0958572.1 c3HC zinc finger-like domain-containing protein [Hirsutella rhossiliensis]
MNATKRKFNVLLQGLGNPDSPPSMDADSRRGGAAADASSTHDALLQKRRRLGLSESTAPKNYSPSDMTSTLASLASPLRKSRKQAASASRTGRDALVKYCPGDRSELLRRLATFQELTDWTPKPDRVNEIEWAKRGWICHAKETVRCVLCHKELLVKLNRKQVDGKEVPVLVPSEIEDALVDKYCELVVASHQPDCLWRRRGCDDSLLRLSFSNARATLVALRQRYDELGTRAHFLPYEANLRLPSDLDLDQVLSQLPPDFFTDRAPSDRAAPSAPKPVNRPALALALMGWQGLSNPRIGAVPNSASCHTCHRRLGLWMFKSKEVDENGKVLVPAPMDHLDPLREHRFFCPWKNAQAQSTGGPPHGAAAALAGWNTLLQTIRNESSLRSVYEGSSKTSAAARPAHDRLASTPLHRATLGTPGTPARATPEPSDTTTAVNELDDAEAEDKARDAKDKERWARLKKVKSLFDSKGARILRRSISRPGSGQSHQS